MARRKEHGFPGCGNRRFRGFRTEFRGFRHHEIIQNESPIIQYLTTSRASIFEQEHVLAFPGQRNYNPASSPLVGCGWGN
jgi:hypothetical protein